ncbi:MAG: hypothetical protein IJ560_02575 [Alphaproteobacteria bacterium]|nr:hypothetical protein [Alphaproteobacteria bacterium]
MKTTYRYIVEYDDGFQLMSRDGISRADMVRRLPTLNMKQAVSLTIEKNVTYTKPSDIVLWPDGKKITFCYKITDGQLPKNIIQNLVVRHR